MNWIDLACAIAIGLVWGGGCAWVFRTIKRDLRTLAQGWVHLLRRIEALEPSTSATEAPMVKAPDSTEEHAP